MMMAASSMCMYDGAQQFANWHNGAAAGITPQRDNPLLEAKTKRTECELIQDAEQS
jgi:hypothetical protein